MFLVLIVDPITGNYGEGETYLIYSTQEKTEKEIGWMLAAGWYQAEDFILYNLEDMHTGRVDSSGRFK
jgi:hypothetical protein